MTDDNEIKLFDVSLKLQHMTMCGDRASIASFEVDFLLMVG